MCGVGDLMQQFFSYRNHKKCGQTDRQLDRSQVWWKYVHKHGSELEKCLLLGWLLCSYHGNQLKTWAPLSMNPSMPSWWKSVHKHGREQEKCLVLGRLLCSYHGNQFKMLAHCHAWLCQVWWKLVHKHGREQGKCPLLGWLVCSYHGNQLKTWPGPRNTFPGSYNPVDPVVSVLEGEHLKLFYFGPPFWGFGPTRGQNSRCPY